MRGVQIPDSQDVAGSHLVLNGVGTRTYSFLRIALYVAGLYLEHRTSDPNAIINSSDPKLVLFVFTRDIDADRARKSWQESFDENCHAPCSLAPGSVDKFLAGVPSVRKGDSSRFLFTADGLQITMNGKVLGQIHDQTFMHVVMATFIGPHPSSPSVRNALLGQ
jgi:hypothetical protein